jgi:hypothetical protein
MKKTKLAVTLTTTVMLAGDLAALSREQTKEQLARLEPAKEAEAPMGAMCYETAAPPQRIEYICPKCGERTYYSNGGLFISETEVATCRRLFLTLPKREVFTLDESSFCQKCSKKPVSPDFVLTARYADGKTESVHRVASGDLRLLAAVLEGRIPVDAPEVKRSALGRLARLGELAAKPTK